jgi:hypothetical protein
MSGLPLSVPGGNWQIKSREIPAKKDVDKALSLKYINNIN